MSGEMSADELAALGLRVMRNVRAVGYQEIKIEGATLVVDAELPERPESNYVTDVTASSAEAFSKVLNAASRQFRECTNLRIDLDHRAHQAVVTRLLYNGYERNDRVVVMLPVKELGATPETSGGTPSTFEIRPVETAVDMQEFIALQELDPGPHVRLRLRKCPPGQYFVARIGGSPIGFCNGFAGTEEAGWVDDLFLRPEHRNLIVTTALLRECARHASHGGKRMVFAQGNAAIPARRGLWSLMGVRPVAVASSFFRDPDPD